MAFFGAGLPLGEGAPAGGVAYPTQAAPVDVGALLAQGFDGGYIGSGYLWIDGVYVAILHQVTCVGSAEIYEQIIGPDGGRVDARYASRAEGGLRAEYADVLSNVALFTVNQASYPGGGPLPVHEARFVSFNGLSMQLSKCNIMPSGELRMTDNGWASGSLEVKSCGQTLPNIEAAAAGSLPGLPGASAGGSAAWVNEQPGGSVNGSNRVFTLSQMPVTGSLFVIMNGLILTESQDYTISEQTVTLVPALTPLAGAEPDQLWAKYQA